MIIMYKIFFVIIKNELLYYIGKVDISGIMLD